MGQAVRANRSTVEIRNWRNGRANRFIFYMFKLLGYCRDNGDMAEFWRLG